MAWPARRPKLQGQFMLAGAVCFALGISRSKLDKLDSNGALPHCCKITISIKGRDVAMRRWLRPEVEDYGEEHGVDDFGTDVLVEGGFLK